jgi:tetratricopeptide (TPR) repeat protein
VPRDPQERVRQRASARRDANVAGRDQLIVNIAAAGPGEPELPGLLPRDVPGFTGRADELDRLAGLAEAGAVAVTVISGTAGVGKTALAVHAAHQLLPGFPDGHLYADLRGYTVGQDPAEPGEVLELFLRRLGVLPSEIPTGIEERSGMLRQLLATRRILMLLDNAQSETHVRPLLPGAGGSVVLITSRSVMPGLEADHRIGLGVMSEAEAAELLAVLAGPDRAVADPEAVAQLARLCGWLPLALRIAGQILAAHLPWPVARLAGMLDSEQDRLDRLLAGDMQVQAAFVVSYRLLPDCDARMFRLLSLHPGPDFGTAAVASLTGIDSEAAGPVLNRLVEASLITEDTVGRFGMHDLLRLFARQVCQATDDQDTADAAEARLVSYYATMASFLNACLDPRIRPEVVITGAPPGTTLPSVREALARFEAERLNMLGVLGLFQQRGQYDEVWMLSEDMDKALRRLGYPDDLIRVHKAGLAAARHVGDTDAEARALGNLGNAYGELRIFDEAISCLQQNLAILQQSGNRRAQGRTLNDLGIIHNRAGNFQKAIDCYRDALKLRRETDDQEGEGITLTNLGLAYRHLGRFQESADCNLAAREIFKETDDQYGEANALNNLGSAYREMGQLQEAVGCHLAALAIAREIGDWSSAEGALNNLGNAYRQLGQSNDAIDYYSEALEIVSSHHDPDRREGEILANLGMAYWESRQPEQAAACLQKAANILRNTGADELASLVDQWVVNIQHRRGWWHRWRSRRARSIWETSNRCGQGQACDWHNEGHTFGE